MSEGEAARNIVERGEWGVINTNAVGALNEAQAERQKLIAPGDFDYAELDQEYNRKPELIVPLGPALVLAGIWKVTGDYSYLPLQILQLLIGAALTLTVAWLALRLFGRPRAAIIAGALWALSPGLSYLATLPLYEIGAVYFTLGIVALYVLARDRGGKWPWLAAIGLAVAAGTLFRQGLILLPLAFVAYELRHSWRMAARTLGIVTAACAIGLIPWTIRGLSEFDQVRPFNGAGGQVLWQSLGADTETFGAVNDDHVTAMMVRRERRELEYGTPAYDDYLREKALDAIADHPFAYMKIVGEHVIDATVNNKSPWVADVDSSAAPGQLAKVTRLLHRLQLQIATKLDPFLFFFALGTAIFLWRRGRGDDRDSIWLLAAIYLSVLVVPLLMTPLQWRYIAPGLFVLMILSGVGSDLLYERLRDRMRESRQRQDPGGEPAAG